MTGEQAKSLKEGDVVIVDGDILYEVSDDNRDENGVYLFTFGASIINSGGKLRWDSPLWARIELPKKKKDLKRIAAMRELRERTLPHMEHQCVRLPNGRIHVQNYITGIGGGLGQHHVHTAKTFEQWKQNVNPKYIHLTDADSNKACTCGLKVGQVREYDGHISTTRS